MRSRRRSAVYARRRKRRMGRVEHDLSAPEWAALVASWAGCAYCGAQGACPVHRPSTDLIEDRGLPKTL